MAQRVGEMQVEIATDAFDADLELLTDDYGFRVESIYPADEPTTAVISRDGLYVRLVSHEPARPVTLRAMVDGLPPEGVTLPGGTRIVPVESPAGYVLPDNVPELVIADPDAATGAGRAGMRYRDLLPGRWGGRFISSLISIPDGGPVPDYVHFHRVRFQLIFVKSGWVRVVYEDQGDAFVMHAGDGVLQPPEIRHRVLEASPGLEVVEVGTPAVHETIADWSMALPNGVGDPDRRWDGQRFVRHVADGATYRPWRRSGWECRDTGIGDATDGLAGVRVLRPNGEPMDTGVDPPRRDGVNQPLRDGGEFRQFVVLDGSVSMAIEDAPTRQLEAGASAAIPPDMAWALTAASGDAEVLEITLPA